MNLRLPQLEECYESLREGKSCTFDFRPLVCLNRSTGHRSTEQPGIKLLRSFNIGNAQRHVIQRATAKRGRGRRVSLRIGLHADRCHGGEQALNQLLSVQRAFLEQRDEILNGVLHTLLLPGRLHAATITADAQRTDERRAQLARSIRELGFTLRDIGIPLIIRRRDPPVAEATAESARQVSWLSSG